MNKVDRGNTSDIPLISYILPVHNSWPYLKYAVESVLEMDSNEFELVISDNHSTDESSKYLMSLNDLILESITSLPVKVV